MGDDRLAPGDQWPTLADVVRDHVIDTCVACGWKLEDAAGRLGVTLKTLYNHLTKYAAEGRVRHLRPGWAIA